MQVDIYDSFKCHIYHAGSFSCHVLEECKVCSKVNVYLGLYSDINSIVYKTIERNGLRFILSNEFDGAGCSAGDMYWLTNISNTCIIKQAAYRCQVGARNVNTHLGILDHASHICTNTTLAGSACRVVGSIQTTNTSYYGENSVLYRLL